MYFILLILSFTSTSEYFLHIRMIRLKKPIYFNIHSDSWQAWETVKPSCLRDTRRPLPSHTLTHVWKYFVFWWVRHESWPVIYFPLLHFSHLSHYRKTIVTFCGTTKKTNCVTCITALVLKENLGCHFFYIVLWYTHTHMHSLTHKVYNPAVLCWLLAS